MVSRPKTSKYVVRTYQWEVAGRITDGFVTEAAAQEVEVANHLYPVVCVLLCVHVLGVRLR